MTRPGCTLALIAVLATLVLSTAPATASASIGGTVCTLAGWLGTLAGRVCTIASSPGRVLDAGKKLAGGHVGGAIGALTGSASKTVARVAGTAAIIAGVVGGAQFALRVTVTAIGGSTNPQLGALWFSSSYWRMAAVAALLTVPFLFAAAIQAMLRSDLTLLLRAAFGYLPLGLLAVGVAAPLTALLLAGSDEMSSIVSSASGHAGAGFLDRVGVLGGGISAASGTVFVSFFIALFTIAAAITLWLELLIRQAAVYVIVLMLPLFFAAMVWPARRIWAARAVELLVALILSKFAIVAVLGLGGAALGHAFIPGIGSFLAGTTLVLLAAFSPWALLRLLPLHELAGAAVGGLRPHAMHPSQAADNRAQEATDATEDMAGRQAAGQDATSADVAAGLPARLLAFTPPAGRADAGGRTDAGGGADPGGPDDAPQAGNGTAGEGNATGGVDNAIPGAGNAPDGTGSAAAQEQTGAPVTSGPNGHVASEDPAAPIPAPETDAFGSTVRHGALPEPFATMGMDSGVLPLDEPSFEGGDALADLTPPAPPALPDPAPRSVPPADGSAPAQAEEDPA